MKTLLEKLNGGDLIEIDFKYRCKCGVRGHAVQFVHPKSAPLRKAEAKAGHFQCSECDAKMFADQRRQLRRADNPFSIANAKPLPYHQLAS